MSNTSETKTLLDKIRCRGYWEILIRPYEFEQHHIQDQDLLELMRNSDVDMKRGWRFPHVNLTGNEKVSRTDEWVGQERDWHFHVELWRLYRSGQFVYIGGIWDDWLDQSIYRSLVPDDPSWKPGSRLPVGDVIYRYLEVFELAARLSLSQAGSDRMHIETSISGLAGRSLTLGLPNRAPFDYPRVLDVDKLVLKRDLSREEIVSNPNDLALGASLEVFRKYEWNPPVDMLRTIQKEVVR